MEAKRLPRRGLRPRPGRPLSGSGVLLAPGWAGASPAAAASSLGLGLVVRLRPLGLGLGVLGRCSAVLQGCPQGSLPARAAQPLPGGAAATAPPSSEDADPVVERGKHIDDCRRH